MISFFQKWDKQHENWQQGPVVYLSATDGNLLREAEHFVVQRWKEEGNELSARLDGPVPDFGELIAQAGAISFFGGTRHVLLRELCPSSLSDKDAKELQALFADLENAVLLVTALHKDKRTAGSKKAKALAEAAQKNGFSAQLAAPSKRENLQYLQALAAACNGSSFAPGAAEELLERAKGNYALLQNETEKLAAFSNYDTIERTHVQHFGVRSVEADVFELLRLVAAGRSAAAQKKMQELFALKNEPVAIVAALGSSFADMLRVRAGNVQGYSVAQVFSQMHYTGSDYRLVKAKENASGYTYTALKQAVCMLTQLDKALKSSALPDKKILLEAAVAELILLRGIK